MKPSNRIAELPRVDPDRRKSLLLATLDQEFVNAIRRCGCKGGRPLAKVEQNAQRIWREARCGGE